MSAPFGSRLSLTPFRVGVAVMVLVTLGYRTWATNRFGWEFEDWYLMNSATSAPFGSHWFHSLNGHLIPGAFLVTWVLTAIAPLSREAAALVTAVVAAAAIVVWALAFRSIFGERTRLLLPLAVLAFTPLAVRPTVWWTSALQMLPLEIAMGLSVWATARYARRHDLVSAALVVASLLLGLFFYEKSVLLVVPVLGTLLFCSPDGVRSTLRRAWPLLVTGVLGVLAYLVFYSLHATAGSAQRGYGVELHYWPGLGKALYYYGEAASNDFLPAVLGGPWGSTPVPGDRLAAPAWPTIVVTALLVLVLVVLACALRRRAWLPLAMVTGYALVATTLIVLSSRIPVFGVPALREERYNIDTIAVGVLAAAMLLAPARDQPSAEAFRHPARLAGLGARRVWIGVSVALVLSLVVSNVWVESRLGLQSGRTWLRNATADIDQRAPVALYDAVAPTKLRPLLGNEGRLSQMLSPLGDKVSFDGPAESLMVFDSSGHLRDAVVKPTLRAAKGPVKGCGYGLQPGGEQRLPLNGRLFPYHWGMQVTAFAGSGGVLEVDVGGQQIQMQIDKGFARHQVGFSGSVGDVRLRLLPGSQPVCVTDVIFGPVSAAAAGAH